MASRLRRRIGTYFAAAGSVAGTTGGGAVGSYLSGTWQLASGHFVPAKKALRVIYPRPDSETASYARHRKAYYDGSNSVEYRIPVGVQFGSWPYRFQLTAGPSGMAVGETYGSANYGVVTWTPTGSVSGQTVSVLVTDQEGNTITVTWTVSTSSSTSDFIFVSTTGNDSTGTGTISAPFQTLSKVMGTTETNGAYGGRCCYFRNGTYSATTQGNIDATYNPVAFIAYPGESVTISLTSSFAAYGFKTGNTGTMTDLFWQGITLDDGNRSATNYRVFKADYRNDRWTWDRVRVTNAWNGTAGGDNTTGIFFSSLTAYRQYIYLNECQESGRNGTGGNAYTLFSMYCCQYVLVERCTTSSNATHDLYLKSSCFDADMRANDVTNGKGSGAGIAMAVGGQRDAGLANGDIWFRHNRIDAPSYVALGINTDAGVVGTVWISRNSTRGMVLVQEAGSGPYTIEQNAIENSSTLGSGTGTGQVWQKGGATYTNTGTECQQSSGVFDSGLLLTGTYRAGYLGTRGAEIQ